MDRCIQQLEALASRQPGLDQAVANIKADRASPTNPHGNLTAKVTTALAGRCHSLPSGATQEISQAIDEHKVIHRPDLYEPVSTPTTALRRVTSLTTFVNYHLLTGADSSSNQELVKHHLITQGRHDAALSVLRGTTGRLDSATWWTHLAEDEEPPEEAETYMTELALSDHELNTARQEGWGIELALPTGAFTYPLYKPTSLEAFFEGTRFRPDLTSAPCGYTAPPAGFTPRPELISRSVSYGNIGTLETHVTITPLPYHRPGTP